MAPPTHPDLSGTWNMVSNENFEPYMQRLDVDFATRKVAKLLKPQKVIEQKGDSFTIRTLSSIRNYLVEFTVGKEFEEDTKGLDNRKCMSTVSWDNDRLICVQKGEKKNRGWTHWLEGGELHLQQLGQVDYFFRALGFLKNTESQDIFERTCFSGSFIVAKNIG